MRRQKFTSPEPSKLRELFTRWYALVNMGLLFIGSAISRVISAVYIFALARHLGVNEFGVYVATVSLAKLTSIVFSLGLDSWLLRKGAQDQQNINLAIGTGILLKIGLGLLWLIGLASASFYLDQTVFPTNVIVVAAFAVWAEDVANFISNAFKATLRNTITIWLLIGTQLLVLGGLLLLLWMGSDDVTMFLWGRTAAFLLGGFVGLSLVLWQFGVQFERRNIWIVLQETFSFGLSYGLATIYGRIDITIVAYVLGKTAAGLYGPAVSLTTTLFLIPLTMYEVMLPIISRKYAQGQSIIRLIARFSLGSLFIGTLLGVGIVIMAYPLVLLVYGSEFMVAADVVVILSGVIVLKSVSFALGAVLVAIHWQNRRVGVQAVAAVFNLVINLLVVRTYGIIGVAHVYVLTELLLMVGYLYVLVRWQQQSVTTVSRKV